MQKRIVCYSIALLLSTATLLQAQQTQAKAVPTKPADVSSGEKMYKSNCAVCHGKDGKGAGPAAAALKTPPTDLTTLAQKNGGTFPMAHIMQVLQGGVTVAHGTSEMPVWGPLFRSQNKNEPAVQQQRMSSLTHYLETLQVK